MFQYSVLFFIGDPDELRSFSNLCNQVVCLEFDKNRWKGLPRYRRTIRELSPNIIHTHSFQPGVWGRLFRTGARMKIVSTVHSPYPYLRGEGLIDKLKTFAEISSMNICNNKTICVSEAVREHLCEHTRIKRDLLVVIRNGIKMSQTSFIDPMKIRNEIGCNGSAKIITTIGRLSEEKGLDVLLTAFSLVLKTMPDVCLVIIGTGPMEEKLKAQAERLGIQRHVRFLGFKNDVHPYLAASQLYVNASFYEGLPMSLIEALSSGVPVVATRVGGVPEVINDRETGILVGPHNPERLAHAMTTLLNDVEMGNRFRVNGVQHALKRFDISHTVREHEQLYMSLFD